LERLGVIELRRRYVGAHRAMAMGHGETARRWPRRAPAVWALSVRYRTDGQRSAP
jgi:hypothetical protein